MHALYPLPNTAEEGAKERYHMLPEREREGEREGGKETDLLVLVCMARCCIVINGDCKAWVGVVLAFGSKVSIVVSRATNCRQSS